MPLLQHRPAGGAPLYRELYARIRAAVLSEALRSGTRLPSARALARDLGVSRNTVELAYALLDADGLLQRRVGSGSVVTVPEHARPAQGAGAVAPPVASRQPPPPRLSRWGARLLQTPLRPEPPAVLPLTPCLPALDEFPMTLWRRMLSRRWAAQGAQLLCHAPPEGLSELRRAIHQHVAAARGVCCDWRQVLVFTSTQQALDTAARLLLEAGEAVWMEEPGYAGARAAFNAVGAMPVPVPVDGEGLDVARGEALAPRARLAYITPSHQYPLGVTMSLARRSALLDWATRADAYVLEDDYDGEFRYTSRPLAATQSLDTDGRVLYVGTFNKVMFPSLRLAYVVVPPALVDAFTTARAVGDGHVPQWTQAAMADFLESGHFGAHVRRMRLLYEERRDALRDALRRELEGRLVLGPSDAGMHVTARLGGAARDADVVERAARRGLDPRGLSPSYAGDSPAQGLVLGFSGTTPAILRWAARQLALALESPQAATPPVGRPAAGSETSPHPGSRWPTTPRCAR